MINELQQSVDRIQHLIAVAAFADDTFDNEGAAYVDTSNPTAAEKQHVEFCGAIVDPGSQRGHSYLRLHANRSDCALYPHQFSQR